MSKEIGKTQETTRQLPVELSKDELIAFKDSAIAKIGEIEKLEGKAAEIAADYRARIKVAKGELKDLCESVESGTEQREVLCREDFLFGESKVRAYRLDTNKFVDERTMLPDERQGDIEADVEAGRDKPPPTVPDPKNAPKGGL